MGNLYKKYVWSPFYREHLVVPHSIETIGAKKTTTRVRCDSRNGEEDPGLRRKGFPRWYVPRAFGRGDVLPATRKGFAPSVALR